MAAGRLASRLASGGFVVTAEINPPRSADAQVVRRRAGVLKGFVDAANVTDSNRAQAAMSSFAAALHVRDAGVEPIVQFTGRDRNRIAIQGDLLGVAAHAIPNILCMSGDDPIAGDHPDAVNVRDLDGLGILKAAVAMRDAKRFLSGAPIRRPPEYFVGVTASPFAVPMEGDVARTVEKAAAGAEFVQTQPVFDEAVFVRWVAAVRAAGATLAVIAGVMVLRSGEQAERMARIPGIAVPPGVVERITAASDQKAEGVAVAAEIVARLRALGGIQGVHLFAVEWPEAIPLVVGRAGVTPPV